VTICVLGFHQTFPLNYPRILALMVNPSRDLIPSHIESADAEDNLCFLGVFLQRVSSKSPVRRGAIVMRCVDCDCSWSYL
jgi:hypothetical protein